MKSIANQYRDLKEGKMSQSNFMRNVRMMMPQYITNVTSFKDAVKILKNKAILTEGDLNRNAELGGVENDFKNLLAKGYSYSEALELLAQNTGMDPDELESMFPQDAVDVEGHEGDLTEYYDPEEKYAASYKGRIWGVIENEYPDISAEVFEDIKDYMDNTTERNLKDKFENPLDAAKQIVAMFSGNEDADIEDMISRGEEEEAGKYTKFQDFEGGLSEEYTDEPTYEYNGKTLYVDNQSGEPDAPGGTVDLYDEDDTRYTATISSIDREGFIYVDPKSIQVVDDQFYPEDEDYEDPDMFDAYGMDASESLKNMDEGYYGWDDPSDKTSYDLERLHDYINQRYEKESGEEIPYESFEEIDAYFRTPEFKKDKSYYFDNSEGLIDHILDKFVRNRGESVDLYPGNMGDEMSAPTEGKINEAKKKKEAVADHPNQFHPQEVRMGIKVELEHTDDLDKAKKIALDHLRENPFYYTALKLAGVESPSAPKVKAPEEKKARKKKEAVELVDKANQMVKVKDSKKKLNEAGGEFMFSGTLNNVEAEELKKIIPGVEIEEEELEDTYKTVISHPVYNEKSLRHAVKQAMGQLPSVGDKKDLGASFDKFKSSLEEVVREVIAEYYDGRDDMNAKNEGLSPEEQEMFSEAIIYAKHAVLN